MSLKIWKNYKEAIDVHVARHENRLIFSLPALLFITLGTAHGWYQGHLTGIIQVALPLLLVTLGFFLSILIVSTDATTPDRFYVYEFVNYPLYTGAVLTLATLSPAPFDGVYYIIFFGAVLHYSQRHSLSHLTFVSAGLLPTLPLIFYPPEHLYGIFIIMASWFFMWHSSLSTYHLLQRQRKQWEMDFTVNVVENLLAKSRQKINARHSSALGITVHDLRNRILPFRFMLDELEHFRMRLVRGEPLSAEELERVTGYGNGAYEEIARLTGSIIEARATATMAKKSFWLSELLLEPESLTAGLHDITLICQGSGGGCNARFEPMPEARVAGSIDDVRMIITNLVVNACINGASTVTISAKVLPAEQMVRIRVDNDGPPIPREIKKKLFTPLINASKSGTGLGLFLSHEFLESMGGTITLAGSSAKRTRFAITLPFAEDIPEEAPPGDPSLGDEATGSSDALREGTIDHTNAMQG